MSIEDRLNAIEKFVNEETIIEYENLLHDHGKRPCDGTWDYTTGKCIPKTNTPPKANAGQDQTVIIGTPVQLVGTATDAENNIKTLTWAQSSGTSVSLTVSADGTTAKFTPVNEGTYVFTFTATDVEGLSSSDDVEVVARKVTTGDNFKVDAGPDITVNSQTFPVQVKINAKITGNISIYDYKWTGLPDIDRSISPTVFVPAPGEYELTLTAKAVTGWIDKDSMKITATKGEQPSDLDAEAELLVSGNEGDTITLDGSRSKGSIVRYEWLKENANAQSITLTQHPTLRFSATFKAPAGSAGKTYDFRLRVFDAQDRFDDDVSGTKVTIKPIVSGEVDEHGTKMLYKTTGKKVPMERGSDHRNGQRYNNNHKFINYMMIGYFKTGRGQEVLEMKTDGPNHGGCDKLPQCMWYEPHIDVNTGKVSLGGEWPHPDNHNNLKTDFTEDLKKPIKETWVGYAVIAYTSPRGNRVIEQWDALDPFDTSGKPTNNWHMNLKVEDTKGKVFPSQYHPRTPPINFDEGLESEIRMHRGTNHDTDMKWCYVYEIVPPTT